jgi:GNAT superfamily N-acetyltransferase
VTTGDLTFKDVTRERWHDLADLFESRGGPRNCWCMVWRAKSTAAKQQGSRGRKAALQAQVSQGVPVGILGYSADRPVAWCSVAPRATYRHLGGPDDPVDDPGAVWSVVCFFIKRELRQRGLTDQLLDAAIAYARRNGAKIIESYPVDPDSPSYRFMGFVNVFERAGFEEIGTAGTRRHVMRLVVA